MPGHFTHIYTARRVADHLMTGHFPDWPNAGGADTSIARSRLRRDVRFFYYSYT